MVQIIDFVFINPVKCQKKCQMFVYSGHALSYTFCCLLTNYAVFVDYHMDCISGWYNIACSDWLDWLNLGHYSPVKPTG